MKRKEKQKFEWNVWFWNFNQDKLEKYDVVPTLMKSIKQLKKSKLPKTIVQLGDFLKFEARYYFMAKCEYEIILHSWPALKNEEKIDIYNQLMLNWDAFVLAFWNNIIRKKLK